MNKKKELLKEFLKLLDCIVKGENCEVKAILPCGCEITIKTKERLRLLKKVD
jgi:hypothetical protein